MKNFKFFATLVLIFSLSVFIFSGELEEKLFQAVKDGNLEVVKELVSKGADVNCKDKEGATPLHIAVLNGNFQMVKYLVSKGANINANSYKEYKGNDFSVKNATPLHLAAFKGNFEIAKFLIDSGGDLKIKTGDSETPLHLAAYNGNLELVRYLVEEKGADVNARDNHNETSLWNACNGGNLDVVKYLISKGAIWDEAVKKYGFPVSQAVAKGHLDVLKYFIEELHFDVNKKDKEGLTLLHWGAYFGHLNVVKYLVSKGAIWNEAVEGYGFPVSQAAAEGHLDVLKYFIEELHFDVNKKDDAGWTLLHWGAKFNQPEVVKYLVSVGADVSIKNNDGKTPLDLAKSEGNAGCVFFLSKGNLTQKDKDELLLKASEKGDLEGVKFLIENGADVNAKGCCDYTPLHEAAEKGHLEVVKYLISKGADVNAKSTGVFTSGYTPLHMAAGGGYLEVVKYLVSNGVDVNAKGEYGDTPLHEAAEKGHLEVVKYLVKNGADVNAKNEDGDTPLYYAAYKGHLEVVKYLISKGAVVNAKGCCDYTPLHKAAEKGHLEVVKYLVSNGVDVNAKGEYGDTPLHEAAEYGYLEVVKYLVKNGADVNARGKNGETPLHKVAEKGNLEIVKYLVENGADVNIKDNEGKTPLDIAFEKGFVRCVFSLLKGRELSGDEKNRLLLVAVKKGNLEDVKFLIKKGADPMAKVNFSIPFFKAAVVGKLTIVKYFIEGLKYDVNEKDKDGDTLLHGAAMSGRSNVVEYLISKGVDVNEVDSEGKTPLHLAVEEEISVVEDLISAGANVNARDNKNLTPLWYACKSGNLDIVKYLVSKGAVWDESVRGYGFPVSQAAVNGNLNVVKYFVEELGFDVNKKDELGLTLMHFASMWRGGIFMDAASELGIDKKSFLGLLNISKNVEEYLDQHIAIIEYLLSKGADINARDYSGRTPLDVAVMDKIREYLKKHGGKK